MAYIPHQVKVLKGFCQECVQEFGVAPNVEIKVNIDLVDGKNFQDVQFLFEASNLTVDNMVLLQNNRVVNTGTLDLEVTPFLDEIQVGERQTINNLVFLGLIDYPAILPNDMVNVQGHDDLQFKGASGAATAFNAENGTLSLTIQAWVNICVTVSQQEIVSVNASGR